LLSAIWRRLDELKQEKLKCKDKDIDEMATSKVA
jgi:hypothetical protein